MSRSAALAVLDGSPGAGLARGEVWFAPAVLESRDLPNTALGVAELARSLGADLCFLSCGGPQPVARQPDVLREVVRLVQARDLACGAVVDGPWQRLSQARGLLSLLEVLSRPGRVEPAVAEQAVEVQAECTAWIEAGADLVLLADDVAYGQGPYFAPSVFARLLLPHYRQILRTASLSGVPLGFHSDGDLTALLPALVEAGFRFLSLEPEATGLADVRRDFGPGIVLLSGVHATWLTASTAVNVPASEIRRTLRDLDGLGGVILASTCGLYDAAGLAALERVYGLADALHEGPS